MNDEAATPEERMRRLEDMHGGVSLADRMWAYRHIKGLEAHLDGLQHQNRLLKEQLGIWKRKAGENQLVAGRWQYLFEQAMKTVNQMDDIFEYAYKSMTPQEIKNFVVAKLTSFTDEVSKIRKGPLEEQKKK